MECESCEKEEAEYYGYLDSVLCEECKDEEDRMNTRDILSRL